jgi:indolepyruvate ferredoxin oxidoreductase beta subunit
VNDIETALKSMGAEVFAFDAFELAERAGETKSVNVVMLGGMATLGNSSVKVENFKEALKEVISEKLLQVNLQAFDFGYDTVTSLKSKRDKHY